MVRPGGRLVYSTCTFSPEENEGTVARFLEAHSEFTITAYESRFAHAAGQPGWVENCPEQVQNTIRL
jgi:16S rRNA C967 or C1407 C5-methylase (RsmB/RsmF family)